MVNVIGIDRIVFTTDYPFGNMEAARQFFDQMPITPPIRKRSRTTTPSACLGSEDAAPKPRPHLVCGCRASVGSQKFVKPSQAREDTMRIVGIEEHVNRPGAREVIPWLPEAIRAKVLPSVEQRIADMDAAGISVQVLSAPVTSPGPDWSAANPSAPVMPIDESAVPMMQAVNEELYQMVSAHPDRFSAFATLPVGVPEAAAAELERAVPELGLSER